jgi:hypothetical protein
VPEGDGPLVGNDSLGGCRSTVCVPGGAYESLSLGFRHEIVLVQTGQAVGKQWFWV